MVKNHSQCELRQQKTKVVAYPIMYQQWNNNQTANNWNKKYVSNELRNSNGLIRYELVPRANVTNGPYYYSNAGMGDQSQFPNWFDLYRKEMGIAIKEPQQKLVKQRKASENESRQMTHNTLAGSLANQILIQQQQVQSAANFSSRK